MVAEGGARPFLARSTPDGRVKRDPSPKERHASTQYPRAFSYSSSKRHPVGVHPLFLLCSGGDARLAAGALFPRLPSSTSPSGRNTRFCNPSGATARNCYRSRWSLRSRLRLPATDARSARGISKLPRFVCDGSPGRTPLRAERKTAPFYGTLRSGVNSRSCLAWTRTAAWLNHKGKPSPRNQGRNWSR